MSKGATTFRPPGCCNDRAPRRPRDLGASVGLCKALGDRTRLTLVWLLATAERPLCVCELESQFDLSQPTISHHLRVLRDAGLVQVTRQGTWVYYEVSPELPERFRNLQQLLSK